MVVAIIDVLSALILAGFVLLVASLALSVLLARRRRPTDGAAGVVPADQEDDAAAREARHRMVDERGSELIERRVELDARRGTLGSYADIDGEFSRLQQRLESGEISEDEFEREKVRLLMQGHT